MKPLINFHRNLFPTIGDATPTQLTKQHKYEECYDVLKIELGTIRTEMHWLPGLWKKSKSVKN